MLVGFVGDVGRLSAQQKIKHNKTHKQQNQKPTRYPSLMLGGAVAKRRRRAPGNGGKAVMCVLK